MTEAGDFIVPQWPAPTRVRAASTTRRGGHSPPPFDGLNLGAHVGDDPEAVMRNRAWLRRALALPADPVWLRQVHGAGVVHLDGAVRDPEADAAVTGHDGRVCVVQTADCLPVLLTDRSGERVGAVHAGWRGLAGGVIEAAVAAMGRSGGELLAWLGPAIGPAAYEVGDEVRREMLARAGALGAAFRPAGRGRWLADLYQLARLELQRAGVGDIYGGGWCTLTDPSRFFSHRRDGSCGRMATLIWLQD